MTEGVRIPIYASEVSSDRLPKAALRGGQKSAISCPSRTVAMAKTEGQRTHWKECSATDLTQVLKAT